MKNQIVNISEEYLVTYFCNQYFIIYEYINFCQINFAVQVLRRPRGLVFTRRYIIMHVSSVRTENTTYYNTNEITYEFHCRN